jgi:hypothetical protein
MLSQDGNHKSGNAKVVKNLYIHSYHHDNNDIFAYVAYPYRTYHSIQSLSCSIHSMTLQEFQHAKHYAPVTLFGRCLRD